jgi:hypothetical protein
MTTKTHNFTFTHKDGTSYEVEFTADYELEDVGIGPYEFWGAKCNDKQLIYVVDHVSVESIQDDEGNDVDATDALEKAIYESAEEYANENAPDPSERD